MRTSYLFLADGFEEIEAISPVDIMRRAGMKVWTVSITDKKEVKGAHGVVMTADMLISEIDTSDAEWLILPGGMPGATNLAACEPLTQMLQSHWFKGGKIAAICASPAVVLAPIGIMRGQDGTCYPTFKNDLIEGGTHYKDQRIVESGSLLTANGPSSAMLFGFSIVSISRGKDEASSVASGMLV